MVPGLLIVALGCAHAPVHPAITPSPRQLRWQGRRWRMRGAGPPTGAGPTVWSDAPDAVVVHDGQLCLALTEEDGRWRGAEVWTAVRRRRRVTLHLAPLPHDDPGLVMGWFLYRDDHDELDVEWSRWGEPGEAPLQFVVAGGPDRAPRQLRLAVGAPTRLTLRSTRRGPRFRAVGEGYDVRWQVHGELPGRGAWNLHVNVWPLPGADPVGPAQLCLRRRR